MPTTTGYPSYTVPSWTGTSVDGVVASVVPGYGGAALPYTSVAGAPFGYAWLSGQELAGLGASPTTVFPLGSELRQVWIVGYRGTVDFDSMKMWPSDIKPGDASNLAGVITGHIGVSPDGGVTIIGFHPQIPPSMSVAELVNSIKGIPDGQGGITRATYPGILRNDSPQFAFAANDGRTVIQAPVLVAEGQFDYLRTWYTSNLDTPLSVQYGFPGNPGWNTCVFNCATFPSYLGLTIPEYSGNLRNYIPALEKIPGVKPWEKPAP
jgi:hypothetical protein